MDADRLQEFDEFCRYNRNTTAIRQLLEDWGYQVSQTAVQNWYRRNFPVGAEAKRFNMLTSAFTGVEIQDALEKLLVVNANLIDNLLVAIEAKDLEEVQFSHLLSSVPQLSREIRACASEVNGLKYLRDRRELEIAGAYRVLQELQLIFKDTPFEAPLKEASRSAIAKIENG
jgi:hypothetical protein